MNVSDAVRIDEHFDCTQADLWDAITDSDRLSDWLGGTCLIEQRVGGTVLFDLPDDGVVAGGVVRSFEPPRPGFSVAIVEHTFVSADRPEVTSVCRWSVVATDTGCDLLFCHDGFGEADQEKLAAGWRRRIGDTVPLPSVPRVTTPERNALALLRAAKTILLVSFIGPEVPVTLASAGFEVIAKTGPAPGDWATCDARDGALVTSPLAAPPDHVDLVHLDWTTAFDEYVEVAHRLGAATFWHHSARTRPPEPADNRGCWLPAPQSARQRDVVEAAGMTYLDDHYIAHIAEHLA